MLSKICVFCHSHYTAGIYLLKVNNKNKVQWSRSGVFIVNFLCILHLVIINFKNVIAGWVSVATILWICYKLFFLSKNIGRQILDRF